MEQDEGTQGMLKRMLTTTEVARFLGVHPNTVRHWADQGLLGAVRLGPRRDRRFTRQELSRFIRSDGHLGH